GGADQEDGEQHEGVEHLVANRFAEDVQRDEPGRRHAVVSVCPRSPVWPGACAWCAVTCCTKKSSRVWRSGFNDTRAAPPAIASFSSRSGARSSVSSSE